MTALGVSAERRLVTESVSALACRLSAASLRSHHNCAREGLRLGPRVLSKFSNRLIMPRRGSRNSRFRRAAHGDGLHRLLLSPTMADGSTDCRDPDDCALNGNAPCIRQPLDATMPAQRRSFDLGIHLRWSVRSAPRTRSDSVTSAAGGSPWSRFSEPAAEIAASISYLDR